MNNNVEESANIPSEEPIRGGSYMSAGLREIAGEISRADESLRDSNQPDSQPASNIDLSENDELFRLMIDTVDDYAIFLLDLQGNVVSWNTGAARIKGYQADEIVGQNFSIFYPKVECDHGKPQSTLTIAARDGRMEDEGWRIRKDGSRFWAHVVIAALRDAQGNLKGFSKITHDLTERKQAEEALQKSEKRVSELVAEMEAVLDNMPIPILFAHDPECLHMTGNRTAEEFLRIPRRAEASLSAPEGVRPTHYKPFRAGRQLSSSEMPTQRAARGTMVRDFDFEFVFDDGTIRKMLGYSVPLWNELGQPRGAITVLVDITERMQMEIALKMTEERLRMTLEALRIGTFEDDFTNPEMFWNSVEFELLGLRPGDAPASEETFFRFVHPEDVELIESKWELAKRTGEYDAEFRIIRADGSERWLAGKARFFSGRSGDGKTSVIDGSAARILGLNFDITERKHAELALKESEKQFRAFFDNAGAGLAQINADGHFVRVNDVYCAITGYSREQLLGGMRPTDLDHPDELEADQERLAKFMNGEIPTYRREKRYLRQNGQTVWVHVTATACRNAVGAVEYSAAVISDITERRLAEQAVREKSERLRSILNTAADAIVVFDLDGIIDTVNPTAEKMFGYTANEMIGQSVIRLASLPYQERCESFLRSYREEGYPALVDVNREVIGARKDGSTFPVDLSMNGVNHQGFFTVDLRDITERKRLERHVLEIAAEEQRRIAYELHDGTQQELAGMSMLAEVMVNLLDQAAQKKIPDKNDWMIDNGVHEQLSDISRKLCQLLSEAGKNVRNLAHGLMPVQIDAEGLRWALTQLAVKTNGLKGITCQFECTGTVAVENTTTATHLYRIAQESLNNALQHGKATQIQITLEAQGDRLTLEIRDNGAGFDPTNGLRNAVADETQGMGLRIMEYRARMIGGTLVVRPQATGGMCVKCEIFSDGIAMTDRQSSTNVLPVDERQLKFW